MATIKIAAVGDIMFGKHLKESPLYDILRRSTVTTANLENPLTECEVPADKLIALKSPPSAADHLPGLGLQVVSIANNHAMDYTAKGLLDTIENVTRTGVKIVGGGRNLAAALAPAVIEAGPLKIAFMGVACTLPAGSVASEKRPGIAPIRVYSTIAIDSAASEEQPGTSPFVHTRVVQDDLETVCGAIEEAKRSADLVIISIHWGVAAGWSAAFHGNLAEYQTPLGKALIDAGADMILGHHPHVIHGIEKYRGKPIFYSLGNFIFQYLGGIQAERPKLSRPAPPYRLEYVDLAFPHAKDSMVATISIEAQETKPPKITGVEITPLKLGNDGEPVESTPDEAEEILNRLRIYSQEFDTKIRITDQKGYLDM
jgi:poly-gamma-glutamate capsule biosynthesis protein CapA/YwtB (metallophosphatase superfamily)